MEKTMMNQPIQTNLDDIYLDEINLKELKCSTIDLNDSNSNKTKLTRIIHYSDGSVEVDENGNEINEENRKVKQENKINVLPKRLKLFQLISSPPMDHFVNMSSGFGKKTLKAVDSIGESLISAIGISDSKYANEINSSKKKATAK